MINKAILAATAVLFMSAFLWSQRDAGLAAPTYRDSITVTSPAAVDSWCTASSVVIAWRAAGVAGPLRVDLLRAGDDRGAAPVLEIAARTANTGSFAWYIPSSLAAGEYKVRVRSVSGSPIDYGESAAFSARACPAPAISVTAPAAGDSWCLQTHYWIRWTSRDVSGPLAIELRPVGATSGAVYTIRASVADSGSLDCALPFLEGRLDREGEYRIRVRTVSDTPLVFGDSATIRVRLCTSREVPSLEVLAPDGGSRWMVGSRQEIRWRAPRMQAGNSDLIVAPPVSITLLGDVRREIAVRAVNTGSFAWTVPHDLPAGRYRIRIQQLDDAAMILADESPQFEIEPLRSAPVKPADRDSIDPQVAANLAKLRYWIRFPGPDTSLSPQFGIPGFQENLRTFSGRISLLKNGAEVNVLAAFGAGRMLPGVLTCKLSQQDYAALKDDGARFTLGIFDARGKLVQEVARQ